MFKSKVRFAGSGKFDAFIVHLLCDFKLATCTDRSSFKALMNLLFERFENVICQCPNNEKALGVVSTLLARWRLDLTE